MMMLIKFCLLSLFTLIAFRAEAASFSLSWSQDLGVASADHFLSVVNDAIPNKMKNEISRPITVSFDAHNFKLIAWGDCKNSSDLKTYDRENLYRIEKNNITLNADLLVTLTEDPRDQRQSCLHDVDSHLTMGAIDQALAELYDRTPESVSKRSSFDHEIQYTVARHDAHAKQRKDPVAQGLYLENDPRLLEGASRVFTAVFEDFEVERNFYCARPGMWNYLNMVLEANRVPPTCAKPFVSNLFDVTRKGKSKVQLDPDRIYRVEYIYVHPSAKEMVSKLGHAMLHVIACSPYHPVVNSDCETDYDSHFFLSFNAEGVDTVMDGFTGKGTSKLYVLDYRLKLKSYLDEGRVMTAVPLNLNPQELATLIGTAWEWTQRYQERWNNIGNNCVTQTLGLIRASIPALETGAFPFIIPGTVAHDLEHRRAISDGSHHLIDSLPPEEN